MIKRVNSLLLCISVIAILMIGAAPVPPQPNVTFTLVQGLPEVMELGQTYYVEVTVSSDIPFNFAMAMPDMFYPGRYVVAHGPDRSQSGTEATLSIPFLAKGSTIGLPAMPDLGVPADHAPVAIFVGARYKQGVVVAEQYTFNVKVP
jgi:hypothetical protein